MCVSNDSQFLDDVGRSIAASIPQMKPMPPKSTSVKVVVRCRPLNTKEKGNKEERCVDIDPVTATSTSCGPLLKGFSAPCLLTCAVWHAYFVPILVMLICACDSMV